MPEQTSAFGPTADYLGSFRHELLSAGFSDEEAMQIIMPYVLTHAEDCSGHFRVGSLEFVKERASR